MQPASVPASSLAERALRARVDRSAEAGSLDLHEGIGDPRSGCRRWPESMWLLNERTGEVFAGRCRATNLCRYCQALYVVETVEMLTLDALENAPTIWVVLTAREHLTRAECRDHLRQLRRSLRKRWADVEWFVQVEFQRRGALHLNLLVKGVPIADVDQLRERICVLWCSRVDAIAKAQWVEVMRDGYSVTRYCSKMLAHGLKAEQRPPIGWRGHRTSQTRGYLVRPASAMREEARSSLRAKRRLWRAVIDAEAIADGVPTADLVEIVYEQLEAEAAATTYRFVNRVPGERRWSDTGRPVLGAR
jgi:hypothetical protein